MERLRVRGWGPGGKYILGLRAIFWFSSCLRGLLGEQK